MILIIIGILIGYLISKTTLDSIIYRLLVSIYRKLLKHFNYPKWIDNSITYDRLYDKQYISNMK